MTKTKAEIRQEKLTLRRGLPLDARSILDVQIRARLLENKIFQQSQNICVYCSDGFEVDLSPLFDELLNSGKNLLFPRYETHTKQPDHYQMVMLRKDETPHWEIGAYNLKELAQCHLALSETELQQLPRLLWLIPGVAFTAYGARLGRGKAVYDRLATYGYTMGVFYDLQEVAEIPEESHDLRLQAIVTESRTIVLTNDI